MGLRRHLSPPLDAMLPPLVLRPLYRRYIWGGRHFESSLDRTLPPGDDYAESWELVDRGTDQSVVAAGPLAGTTLGELVRERGRDLLGRHAPQAAFPLLFKFLDACRDLSVQVHPDDARAARLTPPDRGKTEAWYVVDAEPGARIYAGLKPGVDIPALAAGLRAGRCDELLHSFAARPGDCVFIPAGTVHAIGAGLIVAEIQQSSDVTYRLFDWNRTGPDGRPRPLHIEAGLDAVTRLGPVAPVEPAPSADPAAVHSADAAAVPSADAAAHALVRRLVTSDFFLFDEVQAKAPSAGRWLVGGDDTCHFLAVLSGRVTLEDRWSLPPLGRGACVLLPAASGAHALALDPGNPAAPAKLLHVALP